MNKKTIDLWVGVFVAIGLAALLFLALKVGNLLTTNEERTGYQVEARFDNIGNLKPRAPVKSAGVVVGRVDLTRSMEFVTVRTETDALFLEINLIKQLKPRFNVLLRDDKSFPEIVIRREHPAAQLRKHRGAHTIKGDYFGPLPAGNRPAPGSRNRLAPVRSRRRRAPPAPAIHQLPSSVVHCPC